MSQYYLYRHVRNDLNVPFYIGIGNRDKERYAYARAGNKFGRRSEFWNRVYSKCNHDIDIDIIYETESKEEIIEKEKEFIALYGRRDIGTGTLVNMTDGGEGALGISGDSKTERSIRQKKFKHSEESKRKISEANKGRVFSEETKIKISESQKGKKIPKEQVERVRLKQIGRKHSPKTIEKFKQRKGWKHTEEAKAKIILKQKGKSHPHTEETKKKISNSNKGKKRSPESIAKMRLAKNTPEAKMFTSKLHTGRIMSSEHREKLRQANLGRIKTPEEIEKHRQKMLGRKFSEEHKANMRKPKSEEAKKNMRLARIKYLESKNKNESN